jgi:CHRD domain
MSRRSFLLSTILTAVVTAGSVGNANAQQQFGAIFSGLNEVPPVLSQGQGTLKMTLNTQLQSVTYTLTFSGLSATVVQSLIHFARARDIGGAFLFLCTNLGNGPPGTPACPAGGGTVTGMITPAMVIAIGSQNFPVGDFAALTTVLGSQAAYANIQTTNFPAGEIRGEIVQCPPNGCP